MSKVYRVPVTISCETFVPILAETAEEAVKITSELDTYQIDEWAAEEMDFDYRDYTYDKENRTREDEYIEPSCCLNWEDVED